MTHATLSAPTPGTVVPESGPPADVDLAAAVDRGVRTVPPLWPLQHFVAVNPYLGWTDKDLGEAAHRIRGAWGSSLSMPRSFYRDAIRSGRVRRGHLAAALESERARRAAGGTGGAHLPADVDALLAAAEEPAPPPRPLPTVASILTEETGRDWTGWVTDRVSAWAGAYFDRGQASWPCPWGQLRPWAAWRAEASLDRTPEITGVQGFREVVAGLPEDTEAALAEMLRELGVAPHAAGPFVERLLADVLGWAAWLRYGAWEAELRGREDTRLREFVAIRLAFEIALLRGLEAPETRRAWEGGLAELHRRVAAGPRPDTGLDLLLQEAYENAFQEELLTTLDASRGGSGTASASGGPPGAAARPSAHAVFCIDVRSEVFRRALESTGEDLRTTGFAGFFGFPIEYVPLGDTRGGARCPVLLTPDAVIPETTTADGVRPDAVVRRRRLRDAISAAWLSFKLGAVSCFAFVGPVGLSYIRKLVGDSLGRSRPVPDPRTHGLSAEEARSLAPSVEPGRLGARDTGIALDRRIDTAEGALRGMSLTDGFARVVLLAGHGATVVNTPHASGLDCGACGGHGGEANARVAAGVFNDPRVREGLAARGIHIPDDTVFVAARHDTTLDEVTILDRAAIPESHITDVAALEARLERAGRAARAERAPALRIRGDVDRAVKARSRDWSQVRPEWGLAGCASFIAAPRRRTRGLDLAGRAFLHDYTWREDDGFGVLELILTAPVVVASWISLQYYGSTVDPRRLGAGNKTLHNVVGALGVFEGGRGDLRTGLPTQSVHDGERFVHEPLRLNVIVEAPRSAISEVIEGNPGLRNLVDHRWLHLWAMDDEGRVTHRYAGGLVWEPASPGSTAGRPVAGVEVAAG